MNRTYYFLRLPLFVLTLTLVFGLAGPIQAQTRALMGRVLDATENNGLPGVNILLKGTANGTTTDADGNFRLSVPNGPATLVFSSVGYVGQETTIGVSSIITVTLQPDARSLNEVVVVGYGQKTTRKLTESIGTVQARDIIKLPVSSPEAAIQGRVSGVQITSVDGTPGAGVAIRIRGVSTVGNNQPLFVVDGVPIGDGTSNQINPADVESISVLKDASSASIYGLRAANGVVLITTKRGKQGKPRVNFDVYSGVQNFPNQLDMLNTQQYVALATESINNANAQAGLVPGSSGYLVLAPDLRPGSPYLNIDNSKAWRDAALHKNAPVRNYNLSLSGGNDVSNYFISLGYYQQQAMVNKYDLSRYSFRVNSDHKVGSRLKIGQALTLTYNHTYRGSNGTGDGFIYASTTNMPPILSIYDTDHRIPGNRYGYTGNLNVAGFVRLNNIGINAVNENHDYSYRLLGNIYAELEIIKGLKFRSVAAVDYSPYRQSYWRPGYTAAELGQERNTNNYQDGRGEGIQQVFTNTFTYNGQFGGHSINAIAGMEYQEIKSNYLGYTGANFQSTDPNFYSSIQNQQGNSNGNGGFAYNNASSSLGQKAYASRFGRLSYDYKDTYLVTLTARYDQSSNFAPQNRSKLFPAVSAAWRISNESFFQNKLPFVTDLKLRGSWGQLGNDKIGLDFPYLARVQQGPWYTLGTGQSSLNGTGIPNLVNSDLRWEINESTDAGFDLTLFGRLNLLVTYYNRNTKDFLYSLPVNTTSGFTSIPVNLGLVNNRGLEFETSYKKSFKSGLTLDFFGNITTVKNKLVALAPNVQEFASGNYRTAVGYPIGYFYGYKATGIYQNQEQSNAAVPDVTVNRQKPVAGDMIFQDNNGPGTNGQQFSGKADGLITTDDRTNLGKTIPDFFYGFGVNANWKGFDLAVMFQGISGNSIYNSYRAANETMAGSGNNQLVNVLGHWTGEGTSNTIPRATARDLNGNARFSSRWIEPGGFLRLKNVQLGYTVPKALLNRLKVAQTVRVYIAASNLFRITKYTGLDPEVTTFSSQLQAGTDNANMPQPRTVQIGANLTF
ncbi:TonB-dependent receptor [Spirosoma aureum]|uniref:TonB-dependent receptor n=1 Tax=Spirosoma aureum TaxID=2692134 RepID=A0A6G9AXY9_9BACT|nr:TonB-dependent receptor [Spirosoma aureum]QIP17327.1 TonB-dependent receptor [Spirosoma aureum]